MKRKTTEEERKLFQAHVAAAVLKPKGPKSKAFRKPGRGAEGVKELDGNTAQRLRRGEIVPGGRLDLHGMTQAAAHRALRSFLTGAQTHGVRLALVITGVGNPKTQEGAQWSRTAHGVLKEMVPRWLNEQDFAGLVSGWLPAHRRHGGQGALYVYLRKRP